MCDRTRPYIQPKAIYMSDRFGDKPRAVLVAIALIRFIVIDPIIKFPLLWLCQIRVSLLGGNTVPDCLQAFLSSKA
jgi:hypothetical protein